MATYMLCLEAPTIRRPSQSSSMSPFPRDLNVNSISPE
jgi:hypothetical protein